MSWIQYADGRRREQVGVTTDLGSDPTLASDSSIEFMTWLGDYRHRLIQILRAHAAVTKSTSPHLLGYVSP